jgi:Flp pilus assembly pilin Flp
MKCSSQRRQRSFVSGATLVETLVLVVLVALVVVGSVRVLGGSLRGTVDSANDSIETLGEDDASSAEQAGGSSGRVVGEAEKPATKKLTAPEEKHERQQRAGTIHPLVILIVVGLMILLFFVMFAGARDES